MEGKPLGYEYDKIASQLENVKGVKMIHSLHVWSLSVDKVAMSVHLAIDDLANEGEVLQAATQILKQKF